VHGHIIYVNDKFCSISGYSREELLGQDHIMLNSGHHPHGFFKEMYQTVARRNVWHGEICNRAKSGHLYWVDSTIVPFMGNDGKPEQYIAIRTDITALKEITSELHEKSIRINAVLEELTATYSKMEESQTQMLESLNCAKVIQESILPQKERFSRHFSDWFVFYKPCDIVGGDLFWLREVNERVLVAVIDCTGHGVPGAIMSMTVNSALNHVVDTICSDDPGRILKELNKNLQKTIQLRRYGESTVDAGLDIAICCIDPALRKMTYAAAGLYLYVLTGNNLNEVKGDRMGIGYSTSDPDFTYTNHIIELGVETTCYVTTDGFFDQSGDENGFGFGRQRFSDMLQKHAHHPLRQQKALIEQTLSDWQGTKQQRDDITTVGFRL
jgi:sigma-B regulation protein RsbU (phosphoserine phosphatase)